VGGPARVREKVGRFMERTQVDEIVISSAIYDPDARCHALGLTMEALRKEA